MLSKCLRWSAGTVGLIDLLVAGPACTSTRPEMASQPQPSAAPIEISWQNNMLTLRSDRLPSGKIDTLYLEAFCRRGSTHRPWGQTMIPFKTELVEAAADHRRLKLRSIVDQKVEVRHDIRSAGDEVDFRLELENKSKQLVDIEWAQACIRIGAFTGCGQDDYFERCFIFTDAGLTRLHETDRTLEALYTPGQVYVPAGINLNDVNPRPISGTRPVNGLIGCISADEKLLLATAWNRTQELFQGVLVCIHSDFRVGGLLPGQTRKLHGKIYIMQNDPRRLLARYERDFPRTLRLLQHAEDVE